MLYCGSLTLLILNLLLIIQLCGAAHLALGLGSVAIPKMLDWKSAFEHTPILIKQMFWTYAGYILFINIYFGVISFALASELVSGSGLALGTTFLIAAYWIARVVVQFTYFDTTDLPKAFIYKLGEWLLTSLFIVFSIVYSYLFYLNLMLWMNQA